MNLLLLLASLAFSGPAPFPIGARYEIAFSPNKGALDLVLKAIGTAKTEILVAAYSFTSKPVSLALLEAHNRGVTSKVVADKKANGTRYSAASFLANQGIPVRLNGMYAIHHHKFLVIDQQTIETGSFNFTASAANKNAENVLVIWNTPPLASVYKDEWKRLWDESVILPKKY